MEKKHEYLKYEDHYETRDVGTKARSSKRCEHCGLEIPKGTPHTMHHFYPEFDSYPVHKECNDAFMASLLTEEDIKKREREEDNDRINLINNALENDELVLKVRDVLPAKLSAIKIVKDILLCNLSTAKEIVDAIAML